jgi:quercetin dioxygenase-like cupin family protein
MRPADIEILDLDPERLGERSGAILSRETGDLDVNLVRFAAGAGVAAHVNREVDVLVIAIAGSGTVEVESGRYELRPGQAALIPKGTRRSFSSPPDGEFVYLTIHRRRRGLMPRPLGTRGGRDRP